MTEEEKQQQLLLVDLCARLSYGLKVKCGNTATKEICELVGVNTEISSVSIRDIWAKYYLESVASIKPYLRPMSSMTQEEENEYYALEELSRKKPNHGIDILDWLNAHYLDYRDLIGKGLALIAPEGMYKI